MFTLHNTVKITHGNVTRIAQNSINDFKSFIYSNTPYAVYILAGGGTLFCERTQLVSINTDVLKGALYAEYSAQFQSADYDGAEFSRCGLSGDGVTLCNEAAFEPVVKEAGKPLFVSVTVYATGPDGTALPIVGGDNPLAGLLLGSAALGETGYACTDFNFDDYRFCGLSGASVIKPCALTLNDGVTFSTNTDELKCETVFTSDSRPVLKTFNIQNNNETAAFSGVPNGRKCVFLDYPYVNNVVSVSQNGNAVDVELYHCFDTVYKTDGVVELTAGANAEIRTDLLAQYAAVRTDNEILLYGVSASRPVKKMTLTVADDEDFYVCKGGFLALFGPSRLRIFRADGTLYCSHSLQKGAQNVVVNEGTAFHVCTFKDTLLSRYKVTASSVSSLTAYILPAATIIFESWFSVGVAAEGFGYYFDTSTVENKVDAVLYGLFRKYGTVNKLSFGRNAVYMETRTGAVCVNLLTGEARTLTTGGTYGVWGDLVLTNENGAAALWHYRSFDGEAVRITGADFDAADVSYACILGGFVLVMSKSGKVSAYYRNKKGAFIYSNMFNPEQTAIITLRHKRLNPAAKSLSIKAKVTVA